MSSKRMPVSLFQIWKHENHPIVLGLEKPLTGLKFLETEE